MGGNQMGFFSRPKKSEAGNVVRKSVAAPSPERPVDAFPTPGRASAGPRGEATAVASPSTPGQSPFGARDDDRENAERLYRAAIDAKRRGETVEAQRYFARILNAYPDFENDKSQRSWTLAATLEALAKMAERDPAVAVLRYRQAALVYERISAVYAAKGDSNRAREARDASEKAYDSAEAAETKRRNAADRQDAFLQRIDGAYRYPKPRG